MKRLLLRTCGARFLPQALLACAAVATFSVTANASPAKPPEIMTYAQLRQAGWVTPPPPYPAVARMHHESGTVFLYLKTDAAGKIAEDRVADQPDSVKADSLRNAAISYTRANWHGPPNSQTVAKILFYLM